MTSSKHGDFFDEIREKVRKTEEWYVSVHEKSSNGRVGIWTIVDSGLYLHVYPDIDTKDSDCLSDEEFKAPYPINAKLVYSGTTLLQGELFPSHHTVYST